MTTTKHNLGAGGERDNQKNETLAVTADPTTSAEIAIGSYVLLGLSNVGQGDVNVTIKATATLGGDALTAYDEDGGEVIEFLLPDDSYRELPRLCAAPNLLIYGDTTATLTLHAKKQS